VREKTAETTELAAQLRSNDAAVGEMRLQLAAAVSAERRVDAVSVQKVSSLSSDCAERERTCAAPGCRCGTCEMAAAAGGHRGKRHG
jgi:hypothetical protein